MLKKILILWISIGLFSITTSCGSVKNTLFAEKTTIQQTIQKKANEIKNSAVPGL